MQELVVVEYKSESDAHAARKRLLQMKAEHRADLADAVIATRDEDGYIHLSQIVNEWTVDTRGGALLGFLYGAMAAHPIIGAAIGAGAIAISNALSDYGIDDAYMSEVAEILQPGQSALFVLLREMPSDDVIAELGEIDGQIIRTELAPEFETRLSNALARPAGRKGSRT